jgi:nucleoside 2-deoxyribosyltransferase
MISKRSVVGAIVAISAAPLGRGFAPPAGAQSPPPTGTKADAMKIYMAGPLGFSEAGRFFLYGALIPKVKSLGYVPIDPWKLTDQAKIDAVAAMPYGAARREEWHKLNVEIGGNNRNGIDDSDMVFAVLDGVDIDSGTAAEIGYAYAKGKPILGYRGDFRLSADNEGSMVNLQVEYFIRQSGGEIITNLDKQLAAGLERIAARVPKRPL